MKVINLYGAPGSGKSTTMAGLVYKLNMELKDCIIEFTPEYFKELVWSNDTSERFGRQLSVLAEQNNRLSRLEGKVDYVITDCPLPLISLYQPESFKNIVGKSFEELTKSIYNKYENINYLLLREHKFQEQGRIHNAEQSVEVQAELPKYLKHFGVDYKEIRTSSNVVDLIVEDIKSIQKKVLKKR